MPLYASGVQIPADLSGALSGPGSPGYNAYNKIGQNYAGAQQQFAQDANARGMNGAAATAPNSYAGNQFATKQGLDVGNLESALGGGLGNTAYQNTLQQRDFGQNEALAAQVAALNKPNLLQQVLGGIGNVGGTAAQIYGAWGRNGGGGNIGGYAPGSASMNGYYVNPFSNV
jgi:hypothetical protein